MKRKLSTQSIVLFLIIILFIFNSCAAKSQSSEKDNIENKDNVGVQLRETYSDVQLSEIKNKVFDNHAHIMLLVAPCASYQFRFKSLPEKLEDLLDGFMVLWPGSVYTNEPIKIIHEMPDPSNPEHVGKVYYERQDTLRGKIYYLDIDLKAFKEGSMKWKIQENEIKLNMKIEDLNPDGSAKSYPQFTSKPSDELFLLAFKENITIALQAILMSYLRKHGNLNTTFPDFLKSSNFYVLDKKWENLTAFANAGDIQIDIGTNGSGMFYSNRYIPEFTSGNVTSELFCHEIVKEYQTISGVREFSVKNHPDNCEGPTANSISLISSKTLGSIVFPNDLVITKDQLIFKTDDNSQL